VNAENAVQRRHITLDDRAGSILAEIADAF